MIEEATRLCRWCGKEKPSGKFAPHRNPIKGYKRGIMLYGKCKKCATLEYYNRYRGLPIPKPIISKLKSPLYCKICKTEDRNRFKKGLRNICSKCLYQINYERNKTYRDTHKKECRERHKEWSEKNKESLRRKRKLWSMAHPGRAALTAKCYHWGLGCNMKKLTEGDVKGLFYCRLFRLANSNYVTLEYAQNIIKTFSSNPLETLLAIYNHPLYPRRIYVARSKEV